MRYASTLRIASATRPAPECIVPRLHAVLPGLSCRALALVDAMVLAGGPIGSAERVAWCFGLRSRFELASWLSREGLPPLHELAGWISVLVWTDLSNRIPISLCSLAIHRGRDPAACYRLVRRITGREWSTVRAAGTLWVLGQLRLVLSAPRFALAASGR